MPKNEIVSLIDQFGSADSLTFISYPLNDSMQIVNAVVLMKSNLDDDLIMLNYNHKNFYISYGFQIGKDDRVVDLACNVKSINQDSLSQYIIINKDSYVEVSISDTVRNDFLKYLQEEKAKTYKKGFVYIELTHRLAKGPNLFVIRRSLQIK